MSRKYNRDKVVIDLAARAVDSLMNSPAVIMNYFVKPPPWWLPKKIYKKLVKLVIKLPSK